MPFRPCPARKNRARVPLQICATCGKCGDIVIKTKYRIRVDNKGDLIHEIVIDKATSDKNASVLANLCDEYWDSLDENGKPPTIEIERVQIYEEESEGTPLPS